MEVALQHQLRTAREGPRGQLLGQEPRQSRCYCAIGQGLGYHRHKGRPGGGERQKGIQLNFGQLIHLTHLGKQLLHPATLASGHGLGKGQAREPGSHQRRGIGYGPHALPSGEKAL